MLQPKRPNVPASLVPARVAPVAQRMRGPRPPAAIAPVAPRVPPAVVRGGPPRGPVQTPVAANVGRAVQPLRATPRLAPASAAPRRHAPGGGAIQPAFAYRFTAPVGGDMAGPRGATQAFEEIKGAVDRTMLLAPAAGPYVSELLALRDQCTRWQRLYGAGADAGTAYQQREIAGLLRAVNAEIDWVRHGRGGRRYSFDDNDSLYGHHSDRMAHSATLQDVQRRMGGSALERGGAPVRLDQPVIADFMNNLFVGTDGAYGARAANTPDIDPANPAFRDFQYFYDRFIAPKVPRDAGGTTTRIATACQFGIWLTAKQGRRVRFVLDGIWDEGTQRDYAHASTKFTARELRFVRSTWDDPQIRDNVKFYVGDSEVLPPWEQFAAAWVGFTRERLDLPPDAEDQVGGDPLIATQAREAHRMALELAEIVDRRGEMIERMTDLLARARAESALAEPSFLDQVGALFGASLEPQRRALVQAQATMAEVRRLRDDVARLGEEAVARNARMQATLARVRRAIEARRAQLGAGL